MTVSCLVKMLCILALCPVLLVAVQTLTIDSQLGTSIEDCFERVSIGEQLPLDAIYRNVSELTTRECETICKQDKQCQIYDYGVGAKGNATCNLSILSERELKEKNILIRHPDFDVYIRRIQCEQSPPSPLKPEFDDPNNGPGPAHRPVFRPDDDEPKRPVDDYFSDSRPFESIRPDLIRPIPPYRPPYHDQDRPDDYNQRPALDNPPSYGAHRPQDIPYKPYSSRPQDIQYKPHQNHSHFYPDPYDILHFQEPYRPSRPLDSNFWRPDPYHPPHLTDDIHDVYGQKPVRPYRPNDIPGSDLYNEKPHYHYIVRPNRKPRPDDGYGSKPDYLSKPNPYQDTGHPEGPLGPPDYYRPQYDTNRPSHKPSYSYNSQYASNYGQSQYHDNSIHVEIYDPPRPYRPSKRPLSDRPSYGQEYSPGHNYGSYYGYDQASYGYGSQSSQSSYTQSQNSHSSYGGTITELTDFDRPQDSGYSKPQKPSHPSSSHRPQKPDYGSSSSGYEGDSTQGYGPQSPKPSVTQRPQRPSYGVQGTHISNQAYSDSHSSSYGDHTFGVHKPSYDSNQDANYGLQKPEKPSTTKIPAYGSYGDQAHGSQSNHGGTQGSYGSFQQSYHEHQDSHYSSEHSQSYGSYGVSRPSYSRPTYGSNRPDDERPIYGERPNENRPSFGRPMQRPSQDRPSYGSTTDINPSYGGNRPSFDVKPAYDRPTYDIRPSYGDLKPSVDSHRPYEDSYNNRPSYGAERPSYDNRPPYDVNRPDPAYQPSYGNFGGSQSGYGVQTSNSNSGYASEGYKNTGYGKPTRKPVQKPKPDTTGSNQTEPDRPGIKPVYEYEVEKPHNVPSYIVRPSGEVITSRPVSVGDYGRDPGRPVSYKACFRRVLAGKRALRSFVRKVVPCERLEDCRRECAEERRFPCESFNYRLDPAFRGKGLCELMTKPIEAFDISRDFVEDKDYDFYELDRNSLEPYCPETLRVPGILHSGFLSSKPNRVSSYQNQWSDRIDWQDTRVGSQSRWHDRFYEDRRYGGRRRYEDEFYVPYQIGVARSNDGQADLENWGTYGGYYGGYDTYYKDRHDYFKSINHWRIPNEINRTYGVKPGYNGNFDYNSLGSDKGWNSISGHRYGSWKKGRWNSSGAWSGLEYGESNYYKPSRPHHYDHGDRDEDVSKDCSSRRRPGMSLSSGAIRRSIQARNVVECEAACFEETEFKCVSYSYRYSNSRGTDNCFLSERPYRGLELSADSGSDVYAMPQGHDCSTISHKPWVESECFWHVRSEAAVSGSAVRAALTVTGLGACEAECIRAHAFFCRGFSFRFDSPTIEDDLENCILTSSPPTSLEAGHGLRPTSSHELYARGNYGRGCEPALYDHAHPKETQCYLQYDNAAKLIGAAIRGQARVRDEEACGAACTDAPFRCLSFSYNNNSPPGVDNCLLSEIRLFDLQRGVDYEHSVDDWLFAFDLFNGQCWRKVHGKSGYDEPTHELPRPITIPQSYPGSASGPGYPSGPPAAPPYVHGSGPPSGPGYPANPGYPSGPGYHEPSGPSGPPDTAPYLPKPDYKPGFRPDDTGPPLPRPDVGYPGFKPRPPYPESGFKPGFPPPVSGFPPLQPGYPPSLPGYPPSQSGPGYSPGGDKPKPGYGDREEPISVSWRHYTVSGYPCRTGTTCAQNEIAGHWACEPEGGEIGSWDYCCAPDHRCGYSEGFLTPWCYVGTNKDQWRPCSEKYYPYHQHNIPHPSQDDHRRPNRPYQDSPPNRFDDRDRPPIGPYTSEADRRYWDELYKNGPQAYYDKYGNPLPGYTKVPTASRPYIKYRHNYPRPGSGNWVPVSGQDQDPSTSGGLGAPRYWPVAYLHKGPPPNMTYFTYNETKPTTTEVYPREPSPPRPQPPPEFHKNPEKPKERDIVEARNHRDEKTRNITDRDIFYIERTTSSTTTTTTTTPKIEVKSPPVEEKSVQSNKSDVEMVVPENVDTDKESENLKGIDDKLDDFTSPIEVLDIEDAKTTGEKMSDLKTLEAEERQIEAIGRLLASRRGSKLVLEKRSQKDLESKNIAVDKEFVDLNFGNRFPTTERRGTIQKVTKEEIEKERNADKSLEVSETTFVRPPRVLSTTENIRKAVVNGKVFYDATIREQRDIFSNTTRRAKTFRQLEDIKAPSVIATSNFGKKKVIKTRNVNPVRRVRRVYRKRYNPEEVRRRLLERERSMKTVNDTTRKL